MTATPQPPLEIVCFGQQNWDVCWTGKQQLMSRLAARGHRVLYVDPSWVRRPLAANEHLRTIHPVRHGFGLRREGPGELYVFTYHYAPLLRWRLNHWRWPRVVRELVRELGFSAPIGFSLRPQAAPLLDELQPDCRVYYAVDDIAAFPHHREDERRRLRALENELLAAADLALAVSPRLHQRFLGVQPRSRLLPNGADLDAFSPDRLAATPPHARLAHLPHPRLGFIGQVDERLDQSLLAEIATARPHWSIVLAGRVKAGVDVSALSGLANVHLLGYQEYRDLPAVLRELDVCLVPYVVNELTRACNPLKVFEYLAAGRPVVARRLDGLAWCGDVLAFADDAPGFVAAAEAALADPDRGRDERLALAAANGWDARVEELETLLRETLVRCEQQRRPAPPRRKKLPARTRWAYRISRPLGHAFRSARVLAGLARGRRPGVRRILVARRGRLGDMIAMLPALRALRTAHPAARITLATQPGAPGLELVRDAGVVDDLVTSETRRDAPPPLRLLALGSLFARGYDLVLSGSRFSLVRDAFLCGAPRLVGLDEGDPEQSLNTLRVPCAGGHHEAELHLALVEALGIEVAGADRVPRVELPADVARELVDTLWRELELPADAPVVALHPGAQKPSRQWPVTRFAALAERLLAARDDLRVVLTGIATEAPLVEEVRGAVREDRRARCVNAAGRTDLRQLVALMTRARVFVSNDTGVMHLARAAGVPLVAILGGEDPARWGPHPGGAAPAIALRTAVPCAPCKHFSCAPLYCLHSVEVDAVATAVLELADAPRPTDGNVPVEWRTAERGWADLAAAGFDTSVPPGPKP
jgi:ADP-heptose:LPS heptosyltransferase/glycosyltransferase involved in cell wall biosynthesis